jgi:hypothetical protein
VYLCAWLYTSNANSTEYQFGDLAPRGMPDGQLGAGDLVVLYRLMLGEITPTTEELLIGDIAPIGMLDGVINIADVLILQRAISGELILGTVTIDTTPPANISLSAVTVDTSVATQLTVTGYDGSVEDGATVLVTNNTTSQSYTTTANGSGAFSLTFAGLNGDSLSITVKDAAGNESGTTQYVVGEIQILSPTDSDTINDDTVNVYGTYNGDANSGVLINGVTACIKDNLFYVNNIALQAGQNYLSAVLTKLDGTTSSAVIQVTSSGSNNVNVSTATDCGVAPLDTSFDISTQSITVQQFDIDYDGDGVVDSTSATVPEASSLLYTYTVDGIYEPEITITHTTGVNTQKLYIVVQDAGQQDDIFQVIWNSMWAALLAGDKNTALTYISPDSKKSYDPVFETLMPYMADINDRTTSLRRVNSGGNVASCAILKNGSGQNKWYMVNFIRGGDGVWRIDSM